MSLEHINAWQAACRINANVLALTPLSPPLPPGDPTLVAPAPGAGYPAGGVTAISRVAGFTAGVFMIELDVAADDDDLMCTATLHGVGSLSLTDTPAVEIGVPVGVLGVLPSLNRGPLPVNYFRQVTFTNVQTGVPTFQDPKGCDFSFRLLPIPAASIGA